MRQERLTPRLRPSPWTHRPLTAGPSALSPWRSVSDHGLASSRRPEVLAVIDVVAGLLLMHGRNDAVGIAATRPASNVRARVRGTDDGLPCREVAP